MRPDIDVESFLELFDAATKKEAGGLFLRLVWIPRFEDEVDVTRDIEAKIRALPAFEREFAKEYLDSIVAQLAKYRESGIKRGQVTRNEWRALYTADAPKWRDWYFANMLFEGAGESKQSEDIELLGEEEERRGTKRGRVPDSRRVRRPRLEEQEEDVRPAAVRAPENRNPRGMRWKLLDDDLEA